MMMQHNKFDGMPIASGSGERFEDRMRRIRIDLLSYAQHRACDDSPWFAARVMSGREIAVKNALDSARIEACVPMRKGPEYRRRGRVIPATMIPVMTSYVLVRFRYDERAFISLRSFEHVTGILSSPAGPHPIGHVEVNRFNALADGGKLDWESKTVTFSKGEKVRISEGPFASFLGEIISCRNDGKGDAVVEITMFAGKMPVLMPLAILEKV